MHSASKTYIGQQDLFCSSDPAGIQDYDKYIVAFSGGKDSTACLLHLLDIGIPKSKIELWHHDIDGHGETFMDWECTPEYCRAFASAFGVPIYFSWKQGGFKREMLRENADTAPVCFECPDGTVQTSGGNSGKLNTRLKFPQLCANLAQRWCSAYLKIMVCITAITNQKRFNNSRTLVISGERGQESAARACYQEFEKDAADCRFQGTYLNKVTRWIKGKLKEITVRVTVGKSRRWVDRWRPVLRWPEQQVWEIIQRYRIRVHPCYYLGFSRCSCKFCIFGNADQFATAAAISPEIARQIIQLENSFQVTIKRDCSIEEFMDRGTPYHEMSPEDIEAARSYEYTREIIVPENETWAYPAGAFKGGCGPA